MTVRETLTGANAVFDYGADPTGVNAAGTTQALQNFLNYLRDRGGYGILPPGPYSTNGQLVQSTTNRKPWKLMAFGASIRCSAAVIPLSIQNNSIDTLVELEGLTIDLNGAWVAGATGGIELNGAIGTKIKQCTVSFNSAVDPTSFKAFSAIGNSITGNGAYFSSFEDCFGRLDDSSSFVADRGISILGNCNAFSVKGGNMNGFTSAFVLGPGSPGGIYTANAVTMSGFRAEDCVYGIRLLGAAGQSLPNGFATNMCRFESISNSCYSFEGYDSNSSNVYPTFGEGDTYVGGLTVLNNPNSLKFNYKGQFTLPGMPAVNIYAYNGIFAEISNAAVDGLTLRVNGPNKGISLRDFSGSARLDLVRDPDANTRAGIIPAGGRINLGTILPTADPGKIYQLYFDGVPSAGVPQTVKVSGG